MIKIKQGHHCPLHLQVKPKITRKGDVNGCFLDKLKPEVETFYCFVLWLADSYLVMMVNGRGRVILQLMN